MSATTEAKVRTLTATAVKEDGWWIITIPEIDAVTATKRRSEIDEYAHSAATGMLDLPDEDLRVEVTVQLPEAERTRWVEETTRSRTGEAMMRQAAAGTTAIVRNLHAQGWSDDDIAAATGLGKPRINAIRHRGVKAGASSDPEPITR